MSYEYRRPEIGVMTSAVHRHVVWAHRRLTEHNLPGVSPLVNMHLDNHLPACVYQPKTNALAISTPLMLKLHEFEVRGTIMDAMAMCGCQRRFESEMRSWNHSQNKLRMRIPTLAMHGTAIWREIRGILD